MEKKFDSLKTILTSILCLTIITFSLGVFLHEIEAAPTGDKPKYGGTFVVAINRDPTTLNTCTTSDFFAKIIGGVIFDTLVEFDYEFNLVPRLARSWKISPDGLTYTFHLAKTKWHDGHPFSSEDVKFSIEQMLAPYHPRGVSFTERIQEILTPDPQTVVFKLKQPFSPFPIMLAYDAQIQPKHLYAGADVPNNPARMNPVGTGPFKFSKWEKGNYVRVVRNKEYFVKGRPYLDEILFRVLPDAGARMVALEKGEVDYLLTFALPTSEVPRINKTPGLKTSSKGHEIFSDILIQFFNLDKAPLNNLKVRQAIAHAIDKNYIVDKADFGLGKVATGPIPSSFQWCYTSDVEKYEYDLSKANKLLDEAGYPRDAKGVRFKTSLITERDLPLSMKGGEILREQLGAVGIDVVLQPSDRAAMFDQVFTKRDFDMLLTGLACGGDPAIGVSRLYVSSNIRPVPLSNASGYRNPKVDDLFGKAATAIDRKTRAQLYYQVQKILTQDLPVIWLDEIAEYSAWRDEFKGLHEWSGQSCYNIGDTWWKKGREKP